jgi:serpin B
MRFFICLYFATTLCVSGQSNNNILLSNASETHTTSNQRWQTLTFSTPAYKKEALRLVIQEANGIAHNLNLPENLPITESNLTASYICPPRMLGSGFGNITTSNYTYYITIGDKFSFLEKRNMEQDYRQLKAQYLRPMNQLNTNTAYQLAVQFLNKVSMDVNGLNRDCDVHVEALFPEGRNGKSFVPVYWVYWSNPTKKSHGSVASVELFEPTKTIRSLRVEDSKYILRKPLEVTNMDYLLGFTNPAPTIENINAQFRTKISTTTTAANGDVIWVNNVFAFDLYAHLSNQRGNILVSPFSVDTALAVTWAGARGETARQMAEVLHLTGKATNVHAGFAALLNELNNTNAPDFQAVIANSLWAQKGQPFLGPFQKLAHDQYDATLLQIDFARSTMAREQINNWARFQSHNKIQDILTPELPHANTRLALVDLSCFKGFWATPFRELTENLPFRLDSGESVSVPTMRESADFNYAENESLQLLELPYFSNRLSMLLLLPKKTNSLSEIEKLFTAQQIEQLLKTSRRQPVNVSLPRFKGASEFNLADTLKEMGMKDAFSVSNANFSGIIRTKPSNLDAVIHETYLVVDEEGAEAFPIAEAPREVKESSISFNADHPFLFLIRHNPTGAILILGRVTNPQTLAGAHAENPQLNQAALSLRDTNAMINLMKQTLNLTDEQVKKLQPLLKKQRDELADLRRETSLTRQERVTKINEMRQANDAQLKSILTPEQTEKWQNTRLEQQKLFQQQRPGQSGQLPGGK